MTDYEFGKLIETIGIAPLYAMYVIGAYMLCSQGQLPPDWLLRTTLIAIATFVTLKCVCVHCAAKALEKREKFIESYK